MNCPKCGSQTQEYQGGQQYCWTCNAYVQPGAAPAAGGAPGMAAGGAAVVDMSPVDRFTQTLTAPKDYFQAIKGEQGTDALKTYFFMFVWAPSVVAGVAPLLQAQFLGGGALGMAAIVIALVGALVLTPLWTVLAVYFVHFFTKMFGGKDDITLTAKCIIYPSGLGNTVSAVVTLLSVVLGMVGLGAVGALLGLGSLVVGLYALQITLWAFEALHEIGQWTAFAPVILGGLATLVVVGIIGFALAIGVGMVFVGGAIASGGIGG